MATEKNDRSNEGTKKSNLDAGKTPNRSMIIRLKIIALFLVVISFCLPFGRLFKLMILDSDFYQKKAANQQLYDTEIAAKRGDIYDCNMNLLATSATVWTVYVTPKDFSKIKDEAKRELVKTDIVTHLSEILNMSPETLKEKLNTESSYVIIKKQVEQPEVKKINEYIADSDYGIGNYIGMDEATKRYYPNNNLASVLLGFVGTDNQGLSGIEAYYDDSLTGIPGRVVAAKTANGAGMPFSYETTVEAQQGNTLVLTMDNYMEYVCEKYLEQAIKDNLVQERGGVLVMDVNTGAIKACAVLGDFNPNEPFALNAEDQSIVDALTGDERTDKIKELRNRQWRNKMVSDTYEPGSVFKLMTVAAALEEHCVDLGSTFDCPGYIVVSGQRYKCHETKGHGHLNLTGAVMNSCNPAFITMGQMIGASTFSRYFEAFGLTQKTGIDLPGESVSVYHSEKNMGPTELSSTSFGQTFNVTPVQLLTACCATVNGGYLVQPHVVDRILDGNGNVIKTVETTTKRQVVSEETSATVRKLAEAVVNGGGGRNAYVPGYRIGGKTGTAQKVTKSLSTGQSGLYVSSFLGIAPMDDPQIAVLLVLDEPMGKEYYGGTICTPVVANIMSELLPYLGYEPQYTQEELANLAIRVPDVVNKPLDEAKVSIHNAGLSYVVVGEGDTVLSQMPDTTHAVYRNGIVLLYTDDHSSPGQVTVPNFTGLAAANVNELAAKSGLNVQFDGSAVTVSGVTAYKQSIAQGELVDRGTIVTVSFKDSSVMD